MLRELKRLKAREVDRLRARPEAQDAGVWALKLGYPATTASYTLQRALGYRPAELAVVGDLKRTSPGDKLGAIETVRDDLAVAAAVDEAYEAGLRALVVCIERASYGCSEVDLVAARERVDAVREHQGRALPLVAKDLYIDPLQIARAACLGADAVLLIAAVAAAELPELMDTCTLLGIEAVVEVHTRDEIELAAECGASILLLNERDRATGKLVRGQATALAPSLPPDATLLACGAIKSAAHARALRSAGYDGVVLGRSLVGSRGRALVGELRSEPTSEQRLAERIAASESNT